MKTPRTLLGVICVLLGLLWFDDSVATEARQDQRTAAKTTIFPRHLRPGDTIRVVAPSSLVTPEAFTKAIEDIRSLGFVPVYRSDAISEHLDFAGTHTRRVNEFLEALHDPDARAIWAVRGGYGASFILPYLDPEDIRRSRKWLVGFSDITVLHAAWSRAGVASLHGPIGTFLARWQPGAIQEAVTYMTTPQHHKLSGTPYRGSGRVSGHAAGGNLALLASLSGTDFMPNWQGAILFLEDVDEAPYRLERYLLQLYQSGAFNGVRAVLVGQFSDCVGSVNPGPAPVPARERVLQFLAEHFDGPIVADIPIGHEATSRPILLGAHMEIDADSGTAIVTGP